MSSVQLLDKTRKIGKLLHNNNSSKVVFSDICKVMREILNSNVLVISRKGKVLGVGKSDGIEPITELLDDNIGGFIDPMLNERLLGVLSTKENVNLETLGFENTDTRKFQAIITPIEIAGERLGTLFIYKCNEQYDIDDIILCEYGTTVVGLEMLRAVNEESAAIVSSLASMMNSISTIFTMDIYRSYLRPKAGQSELVRTGRWASFISLLIAVCIAPLLSGLDQAFHYIQEFTGFVSPGALAIFLAGFFYRRATANGALSAALGSFVFSTLLKVLCPALPWMDRMGIVFLLCCGLIILLGNRSRSLEQCSTIHASLFHTSKLFNIFSCIIIAILIGFYWLWW